MLIKSKELEPASKSVLIDEINTSSDFALLVSEIQKHHSNVEVSRTEALQLSFPSTSEADEELKLNAIFVSLADEIIVQGIKEFDKIRFKAHYSIVNEQGEKVIRKAIVDQGEVVIEDDIPFSADYFLFVDELINPTGADDISDVAPQAWYEGCLVFFTSSNGKYHYYKYCGANCTGQVGGVKYKATPINSLDSCCRAHDRCWDTFGKGDSGCDRQLYNCANKTADPGWWMVAEFGLLCSQGKLKGVC